MNQSLSFIVKIILFMLSGILFFFLGAFLGNQCYADTIRCYSSGKLIYSHHAINVTYTGDMFVFIEQPSEKIILYTGNCLVKVDTN